MREGNLIPTPRVLFKYYKLFSGYSFIKFYILLVTIVLRGLLDGVGIAMFVPLLNFASGTGMESKVDEIIFSLIDFLGFDKSLASILTIL